MRGPEALKEYKQRLCKLVHEVHERRFGYDTGPCDCFCEDRMAKMSPSNWSSTGEALEWLEKLVAALPKGNIPIEITERWQIGEDGKATYHDIITAPVRVDAGACTTNPTTK